MKKMYLLGALLSISILAFSQDVNVSINNQDATQSADCHYRINGICSSEDIGGVDVEVAFIDGITWAVFTNYNEFPVTVLYEISRADGYCSSYKDTSDDRIKRDIKFFIEDGTVGSIVLGKEGSKKVKLAQSVYISRYDAGTYVYDYSCRYSINGLIVRKLSK